MGFMKDETINKTHTQLYIPETIAQVLPQIMPIMSVIKCWANKVEKN